MKHTPIKTRWEFLERVIDRFWSYVDKRGLDECWPWIGATGPKGKQQDRMVYTPHIFTRYGSVKHGLT